jgi:NAD(P)-dependent dehydrogenase (short-subunit alcohol dehydrogenase family)
MTDLRFDGRVAVVTGAGRGLGERTAITLAGRGARVVVNDPDPDEAARVVRRIEEGGGTAIVNGDGVDSPEGGQAIIDAAVEGFGGVDIVVHDTARPSDAQSSREMLGGTDPAVLLAGLFGGYWLTRAAWIYMRAHRYGRIVLNCALDRSIDDAMSDGNTVVSMGLVGLMNILKVEGPDFDLKVNMLVPTAGGDPQAASAAAAYLAHEACAPTGEIFTVQAGGMARMFVGVTEGYFVSSLTTDDVRARVDDYLNPDGFFVPDEASGEITVLMKDLELQ